MVKNFFDKRVHGCSLRSHPYVNVAQPFGPRFLRSFFLKKGPRMLASFTSLLRKNVARPFGLDGEKFCDIIIGAKFHIFGHNIYPCLPMRSRINIEYVIMSDFICNAEVRLNFSQPFAIREM